jgi:hypothetical protein
VSIRYRRSSAAIWRASNRLLVAAVPPNAPTRMSGSAALVWHHLADEIEFDELVGLLAEVTGAGPDQIAPDVQRLLDELVPLGLVEPR